jgi:hypothetical protein
MNFPEEHRHSGSKSAFPAIFPVVPEKLTLSAIFGILDLIIGVLKLVVYTSGIWGYYLFCIRKLGKIENQKKL